jgi:hypothetical protein
MLQLVLRLSENGCASFGVDCVLAVNLRLLMLHICGESKTFGEWYQKTNSCHTLLDCRRTAIQRVTAVLRSIPSEAFADSFQKLFERCQPCVVKDDDYFEGQ